MDERTYDEGFRDGAVMAMKKVIREYEDELPLGLIRRMYHTVLLTDIGIEIDWKV